MSIQVFFFYIRQQKESLYTLRYNDNQYLPIKRLLPTGLFSLLVPFQLVSPRLEIALIRFEMNTILNQHRYFLVKNVLNSTSLKLDEDKRG